MAKEIFHIEGLKELDDALSELPKATARNVLMRVLKKRAQPIADAGERNAPRETGMLAGSYTVSTKLSRRQSKRNKKESPVEVYVGPFARAKSVQTEFGNAHQAAQPHLRPAWDGNVGSDGGPVLEGIKEDLGEEIEKARVRVARKAEREAAKMGG